MLIPVCALSLLGTSLAVPAEVNTPPPATIAAHDPSDAALAAAFERINGVRRAAGLRAFTWSAQLARAAQAHAKYLAQQIPRPGEPIELDAHSEDPRAPGFTGKTPADRAVAAGYPHRRVDENLSLGRASPAAAVDGLMTAIYHRLSLLDGTMDELGIARSGTIYVLLDGRSDYRALCNGGLPAARYQPPAHCLDRRVPARYLEALCGPLPAAARYEPPYRFSCPGGARLDQAYMERFCAAPPTGAPLTGPGTYTEPCAPGVRIAADWWRAFCADPPAEARYRGGDGYYSLCDGKRKVDGNWLKAYCAGLPRTADYAYSGDYVKVCKKPVRIYAEWIRRLDENRRHDEPRELIWPPDGARDLPPAFYDEYPDPLPDLDASGNPLSVQFNPAQTRSVEILGAHLWLLGERGRDREIPLRRLNAQTDPNHRLGPLEFAFFPLQHLGWGRHYEAKIEAQVDGKPRTLDWRFGTRDPGVPVLSPRGSDPRLQVPAGKRFVLFVPPTDRAPRPLASYRYGTPLDERVEVEPLDYSSAVFRISGGGCTGISVELNGGRSVELDPSGCGGSR
jgi:hypothetical protein